MKKITIINGWHDLNTGDSAIIICMIKRILEELGNDVEINIISELNNKNEFFNGSINYIKKSFPKIRINIIGSVFWKKYDKNIIREYSSFVKNIFLLWMPKKFLLSSANQKYYKTINESDIVLSKGGHFIMDRGGFKGLVHLIKCLYPMLVAQKFERPYYIISQSIGPLRVSDSIISRISFMLCKKVIGGAGAVSLREDVSYEHLKKLGIKHNLSLTGDYAFCMDGTKGGNLPSKLARIVKNGDFVVITIRQHCFSDKDGESNYIQTILRLACYIKERFDCNVVFVAHVKGPNDFEDDRIIVKKMINLDKEKRFYYVLDQYSPQELFDFYSKAILMIGTRFHSCIFALASNVPTIAISYSGYKANIMKQFGMERFMFEIEDINMSGYERIKNSVDELMRNRKDFVAEIKKKNKIVMDAIKNDMAFRKALSRIKKNEE